MHIIFYPAALSPLLYPKATPSGGQIPIREVDTQKKLLSDQFHAPNWHCYHVRVVAVIILCSTR